MKFLIKKKYSLLDQLKELFPDSSTRTVRNLLKNKRIRINNQIIQKSSYLLYPNDELQITEREIILDHDVKIIFDCPDYLIIEKPPNLLSVPLDTKPSINVFEILKETYYPEKIFPAHRLDFEASGLLLFCKRKENQSIFKAMFSDHLVTRSYVALVEGLVKKSKGILKSYLKELPNLKVVSSNSGKLAITSFETIQKRKKTTSLKLNLQTGRKHQIRVHLSDIGHPILGDLRYGAELPFHNRIALHAYHLSFSDPKTKRQMQFFSPLPKEFSVDNSLLDYSEK